MRYGRGAAGPGALGASLVKFKFALIFLLTKATLLLLGLTKASTFVSMLLSAGVYWTIWGWKFAVGVVLSIYVHQMGHVQALIGGMWLLTGEGLLVPAGDRSVAPDMERRPGDRPVGNRVRARHLTRVGPNRLCLPFGRESIGAPG